MWCLPEVDSDSRPAEPGPGEGEAAPAFGRKQHEAGMEGGRGRGPQGKGKGPAAAGTREPGDQSGRRARSEDGWGQAAGVLDVELRVGSEEVSLDLRQPQPHPPEGNSELRGREWLTTAF